MIGLKIKYQSKFRAFTIMFYVKQVNESKVCV